VLSVPLPNPTIMSPAKIAKMIGKNFIPVTIQFCILPNLAERPVIHINHVDMPNEIKTNTYQ
jgi:hypothetical protein